MSLNTTARIKYIGDENRDKGDRIFLKREKKKDEHGEGKNISPSKIKTLAS